MRMPRRNVGSKPSVAVNSADRIGALTRLNYGPNAYLYAARVFDPQFSAQLDRANDVMSDYQALLARSRLNQLRFNAALLLGALIIVGLSIITALKIGIGWSGQWALWWALQGASKKAIFPLGCRSPTVTTRSRRSPARSTVWRAGWTSRLARSAPQTRSSMPVAHSSKPCCPASRPASSRSILLGEFCWSTVQRKPCCRANKKGWNQKRSLRFRLTSTSSCAARSPKRMSSLVTDSGQRTLAVKRVRYQDGSVLTFDDITDQLTDQRRAAWSDIARRIAHEIKNPLTPIQLAAERLQRRLARKSHPIPRLSAGSPARSFGRSATYAGWSTSFQFRWSAQAHIPRYRRP